MEDLHRVLEEHAFLKGLTPAQRQLIVGCVKNVRFRAGAFLLREGESADVFYLLRTGHAAIEIDVPGRGPVQMESLGPTDMLGVEWLVSGRVHYDARAVDDVVALSFNGACLRDKLEEDTALGYALTRRILAETYKRLEHVRLARLDVYAEPAR